MGSPYSYKSGYHSPRSKTMPDRAVVDVDWEPGTCLACGAPDNPPRALVALSEDGQWLVVLRDGYWTMYQHGGYRDDYQVWADLSDTGQDAHAVLAAWLEGRG